MITVYELERKAPKYYGLCGLSTEKAIYVRSHHYLSTIWNNHIINMMNLKDAGWIVKRKRDFPTKILTGGFTRCIN